MTTSAAKGETSLVLLLGNKNLSSWSLRPWLVLRQAGISFEEHVFLFEEEGWRERIVKLSPSRKVPALRHRRPGKEDLVVWDSLAIAEYVADLFPDKHLWPSDREARAIARAVSAEMHSGFAHVRKEMSMDVVARYPKKRCSRELQMEVDRIQEIWAECRSRFGSGGPFLFGGFTIADAMFAPIVWRLRTYDVPVREEVRGWYEMMLGLDAMKQWEAEAHAEVEAQRATTRKSDPGSAQHVFAVIFTSQHAHSSKGEPPEGYAEVAAAMEELARKQPGFLGIESARNPDGSAITVSYWESLEAITAWKAQAEHRRAQDLGRERFYASYEVRVCTVERGYKYSRSHSRNFTSERNVQVLQK